jgi:hypothetical protein
MIRFGVNETVGKTPRQISMFASFLLSNAEEARTLLQAETSMVVVEKAREGVVASEFHFQ